MTDYNDLVLEIQGLKKENERLIDKVLFIIETDNNLQAVSYNRLTREIKALRPKENSNE